MTANTIRGRRPAKLLRRALRPFGHAVDRVQRRRFERAFGGVEIGGLAAADSRDGGAENAPYGWSSWIPVREALSELEPRGDDVFVDLGCGKGQALLVAAQLGFRRVLGVEVDPEVSAMARRNIEIALPRLQTSDVRVETCNATEWEVPPDLTVVYMFCPFIGDVFARVLDRLLASQAHNPRPMTLVYTDPWEHNLLVDTGSAKPVRVRSSRWPAPPRWWETHDVIVTYELGDDAISTSPARRAAHAPDSDAMRLWSRRNEVGRGG
jgi:SAM-dependent methyltransferase